MPIRNRIADLAPELAQYRQTLHAHPQLGFQETFASDFVAARLTEWGIPFTRGHAKTGIVATITGKKNTSGRGIALRGDMDALPIQELGTPSYQSQNLGCMHACGHDGHTTCVLGAAKYLAETRNFDGTVYIIFQPAEEGGGGAMEMIKEGLFDQYKIDEVYAIHNAPYAPVGVMGSRPGPIMACSDDIFIDIRGKGGHAALPHLSNDPLIAACKLVSSLQTIVSRNVDPIENAVLSITNIQAGAGNADSTNIIPDTATISGTVRAFTPLVRDLIEQRIREMVAGFGQAFDMEMTCRYRRNYEPTINDAAMTEQALAAARAVVGDAAVITPPPMMGAEDFGAMLMHKPGNYMWVGQGAHSDPDSPHSQSLHHPRYDFNDAIIPIVVEYYAQLVERRLPLGA
jgi:hippurate hydrolase